jgi:hypothetical protein
MRQGITPGIRKQKASLISHTTASTAADCLLIVYPYITTTTTASTAADCLPIVYPYTTTTTTASTASTAADCLPIVYPPLYHRWQYPLPTQRRYSQQ